LLCTILARTYAPVKYKMGRARVVTEEYVARVLAALRAGVDVPLTLDELLGKLPQGGKTSLRRALGILKQRGEVASHGRGAHLRYHAKRHVHGDAGGPAPKRPAKARGPATHVNQALDDGTITIRILGEIPAGTSVEPLEQPTLVELRGLAGADPDHFWLRVRGSSMSAANILDGALVFCRRQAAVEPGQIAVCLLADGTVTLKRVIKNHKKRAVELVPACDGLEPIAVRDVTIQGKVVFVLHHV